MIKYNEYDERSVFITNLGWVKAALRENGEQSALAWCVADGNGGAKQAEQVLYCEGSPVGYAYRTATLVDYYSYKLTGIVVPYDATIHLSKISSDAEITPQVLENGEFATTKADEFAEWEYDVTGFKGKVAAWIRVDTDELNRHIATARLSLGANHGSWLYVSTTGLMTIIQTLSITAIDDSLPVSGENLLKIVNSSRLVTASALPDGVDTLIRTTGKYAPVSDIVAPAEARISQWVYSNDTIVSSCSADINSLSPVTMSVLPSPVAIEVVPISKDEHLVFAVSAPARSEWGFYIHNDHSVVVQSSQKYASLTTVPLNTDDPTRVVTLTIPTWAASLITNGVGMACPCTIALGRTANSILPTGAGAERYSTTAVGTSSDSFPQRADGSVSVAAFKGDVASSKALPYNAVGTSADAIYAVATSQYITRSFSGYGTAVAVDKSKLCSVCGDSVYKTKGMSVGVDANYAHSIYSSSILTTGDGSAMNFGSGNTPYTVGHSSQGRANAGTTFFANAVPESFVIDLTSISGTTGSIHWVALQAPQANNSALNLYSYTADCLITGATLINSYAEETDVYASLNSFFLDINTDVMTLVSVIPQIMSGYSNVSTSGGSTPEYSLSVVSPCNAFPVGGERHRYIVLWIDTRTAGSLTASMSYTVTATSAEEACLSGSTLITMADGTSRRLDTLQAGDTVMAGDGTPTIILQFSRGTWHDHHTLYYFDDGTVIDKVHEHRFYNVEQGFWQQLSLWNIGNHARKADGSETALVKVEQIKEHAEMVSIWTSSGDYYANGLLSGGATANRGLLSDITTEQAVEMILSLDEDVMLNLLGGGIK